MIFKLLFLLLIAFLLWSLVKFMLTVRNVRKRFRDATGFQQEQHGRPGGNRAWHRGRRRKVYTQDMGEYVDFEEVNDGRKAEAAAPPEAIDEEEHITDAEFEDV